MPTQIYEIDPGYLTNSELSQQSELLHQCYEEPPKVYKDKGLRNWTGHQDAIVAQLNLVNAEIALRENKLPEYLPVSDDAIIWPRQFTTPLTTQLNSINTTGNDETARLIKPRNEQSLWAQYKYSVLARNQKLYLSMGPRVAKKEIDFADLLDDLGYCKRMLPLTGGLRNAVWHMWGYVSQWSELVPTNTGLHALMLEIQRLACSHHVEYLIQSTALSDLAYWSWISEQAA